MSTTSTTPPAGKKKRRVNVRTPEVMERVQEEVETHYRSAIVEKIRAPGGSMTIGSTTIRLAKQFGFCYGVERAIDLAYASRRVFPENRIFLIGEIIHNPEVNRQLSEMGIVSLPWEEMNSQSDELNSDDVVIVPAFGAPVEFMDKLEERQCNIIDTTCGDVMKVWRRVRTYAKTGVTSIIHGKAGHEETRATASRALNADGGDGGGHYLVVLTLEDADYVCEFIRNGGDRDEFLDRFDGAHSDGFDPVDHLKQVGVANQTTMLKSETEEIQDRVRQAIRDRDGGSRQKISKCSIPSAVPPRNGRTHFLKCCNSRWTFCWSSADTTVRIPLPGGNRRTRVADFFHSRGGLPQIAGRNPPLRSGETRGGGAEVADHRARQPGGHRHHSGRLLSQQPDREHGPQGVRTAGHSRERGRGRLNFFAVMEWFYLDGNREKVSFDESALGDLVKGGTIGPETMLWNETMAEWQPAGSLFPAWFPGEAVVSLPPAAPEELPPTPVYQAAAEFEKPEIPALDDVPVASSSEPEPKPARLKKAAPGTFERVEMIKDFASYLNANRGWIKFFGVVSIIQGSILCPSVGGAIIGWLPIWLGVNVFQAAKAADLAERTGSQEYMEESLYRLGFFFKLNGIVLLSIFAFFVIAIVLVVVSGVLAGMVTVTPPAG